VQTSAHCDEQACTLVVRDEGALLAEGWQDGTGLANCRQRLVHRFGGQARLELVALANGAEARVHWPRDSGATENTHA